MQNIGPSAVSVLDNDRRQRGQMTTMLSLPRDLGPKFNYQQTGTKLKPGLPKFLPSGV
jgi:hypothetical protein